jgi:peptide deformylase
MRELVKPNDPILVKVAEEISVNRINTPEIQQIIEEILDFSYGHRVDRSKPTVVGLASPQIGISKKVIVVDIGATGIGGLSDLRVYINPTITWASEEEEEWCEGCWSTDKVCGIVSRPTEIEVDAFTTQGKRVKEKYSGYPARIFQHEIDHLSGIEFVNHITDDTKLHWVEDEQWVEYKKNEGWRNWPIKCPREKWEKIKGIK